LNNGSTLRLLSGDSADYTRRLADVAVSISEQWNFDVGVPWKLFRRWAWSRFWFPGVRLPDEYFCHEPQVLSLISQSLGLEP
jgi:hypothetical protein